jgi:hypothetical protein
MSNQIYDELKKIEEEERNKWIVSLQPTATQTIIKLLREKR